MVCANHLRAAVLCQVAFESLRVGEQAAQAREPTRELTCVDRVDAALQLKHAPCIHAAISAFCTHGLHSCPLKAACELTTRVDGVATE